MLADTTKFKQVCLEECRRPMLLATDLCPGIVGTGFIENGKTPPKSSANFQGRLEAFR